MREYGLLRSRRKTLALELKKDGTLLVRAPMRLAKREIDRFVAAHEDWIEKHLKKLRASPALPEPTPEETEALKTAAWAVLPERVAYWSTVMGVRPAGIKITTAKKRYGSCSSKHSLCFSCYLMRSPMEAVDLVVPYPGNEPRAALLRAAGAVSPGLAGTEKAAGIKKRRGH